MSDANRGWLTFRNFYQPGETLREYGGRLISRELAPQAPGYYFVMLIGANNGLAEGYHVDTGRPFRYSVTLATIKPDKHKEYIKEWVNQEWASDSYTGELDEAALVLTDTGPYKLMGWTRNGNNLSKLMREARVEARRQLLAWRNE